MEKYQQRTDLALEAREIAGGADASEIEGVKFASYHINDVKCETLRILSENGAKSLHKPVGTYHTVGISSLIRRESDSFSRVAGAISHVLRDMLKTQINNCALVVGLGNRDITPDAVGPLAASSILVTKHLKQHMPEEFKLFSPVAVISPGVLGTSGIESADYIKSVSDSLKPDVVIVVDALASKSLSRLCRTVQITDTGITPGSGVGNSRAKISKETLGCPVIALGVPTVVDIRSLLAEMDVNSPANIEGDNSDMIVTPKNIDSEVACAGRLVGYSINLALHEGLTIEDIDMMIG